MQIFPHRDVYKWGVFEWAILGGAWQSLSFDKEYLFGFKSLVFATSGILSMNNQLHSKEKAKLEITSYDLFNEENIMFFMKLTLFILNYQHVCTCIFWHWLADFRSWINKTPLTSHSGYQVSGLQCHNNTFLPQKVWRLKLQSSDFIGYLGCQWFMWH